MSFTDFDKSRLHDFIAVATTVIFSEAFCKFLEVKFNFAPTATDLLKIDIASLATNVLSKDQTPLLEIIDKFKKLSELPASRTNIMTHHIDTSEAQPFRLRQYPLSPALMRSLNKELDRTL